MQNKLSIFSVIILATTLALPSRAMGNQCLTNGEISLSDVKINIDATDLWEEVKPSALFLFVELTRDFQSWPLEVSILILDDILHLMNPRADPQLVEKYKKMVCTKKSLSLISEDIGIEQANALRDVIRQNNMVSLAIIYPHTVRKHFIEPEAIQTIFRAIKNSKSLTSLRFENTHDLGVREIHVIAAAIRKNKFLINIELNNCNLEINSYEILLDALKENGTLTLLRINEKGKVECLEPVINQTSQLLIRNQKIANLLGQVRLFDSGSDILDHFRKAANPDEKLKILEDWSSARFDMRLNNYLFSLSYAK